MKQSTDFQPGPQQAQEEAGLDKEDISVLRPSIRTSVTNLKYFAETLQNGTPEVRYMLTNECDVVLECKVCRNLFRSLANFLSHKRFYCQQDFVPAFCHKIHPNHGLSTILCRKEDELGPVPLVLEPEPFTKDAVMEPSVKEESLNKIVCKLRAKAEHTLVSPNPPYETHTPVYLERTTEPLPTVLLEPICQTQNAVFQSVESKGKLESMRYQVRELRKRNLRKNRAWMDCNGHITPSSEQVAEAKLCIEEDDGEDDGDDQGLDLEDRKCRICKIIFPGLNATIRHMREAHVTTRLVFPCPMCDKRFYRPASVRLHLVHDHHKSSQEITRLRKLIYRSSLLVGIRPWENSRSTPSSTKKSKQGIQLRWNYKDPTSTALTPNPPPVLASPLTPPLQNCSEQLSSLANPRLLKRKNDLNIDA